MQKITPFLWFNDNAEEAMNFYATVFKNVEIKDMHRLPEGAPNVPGKVLTGTIVIEGQEFKVMNGGPVPFSFNEAISFFVNCESQEEIDELWNKLTADGGKESQCGWLKDKFGVSWQIIPSALGIFLGDPNPVKAQNTMQAMLQMKKIVIADLQAAHDKA